MNKTNHLTSSMKSCTLMARLDKGKPIERLGHKAMGLKLLKNSHDCQAAEGLFVFNEHVL